MTGGQDEVDDVEGGQHYHHEQHAVDREVPMKISEKFVVLQPIKYNKQYSNFFSERQMHR